MSVDDATNDQVLCHFVEVPGLEWTTANARAVSRYIKHVIDLLP